MTKTEKHWFYSDQKLPALGAFILALQGHTIIFERYSPCEYDEEDASGYEESFKKEITAWMEVDIHSEELQKVVFSQPVRSDFVYHDEIQTIKEPSEWKAPTIATSQGDGGFFSTIGQAPQQQRPSPTSQAADDKGPNSAK